MKVEFREKTFEGKINKFGLVHSNKFVPKGSVTMYIGKEQECFIIPIRHLHSSDKSHSDFERV